MSGIVETTKTTMGLTLKGLELVAMRDYAQLYLVLLETTLRKFNWGYITYSNECPLQQSAAPIMLLQSSLLHPQTPVSDEMLYDLLAAITESRQITVTELGRSLIGFKRGANVR